MCANCVLATLVFHISRIVVDWALKSNISIYIISHLKMRDIRNRYPHMRLHTAAYTFHWLVDKVTWNLYLNIDVMWFSRASFYSVNYRLDQRSAIATGRVVWRSSFFFFRQCPGSTFWPLLAHGRGQHSDRYWHMAGNILTVTGKWPGVPTKKEIETRKAPKKPTPLLYSVAPLQR